MSPEKRALRQRNLDPSDPRQYILLDQANGGTAVYLVNGDSGRESRPNLIHSAHSDKTKDERTQDEEMQQLLKTTRSGSCIPLSKLSPQEIEYLNHLLAIQHWMDTNL